MTREDIRTRSQKQAHGWCDMLSAMPRKKRLTATKVTAYLPYSVDLTKLKSGNTLDVQVRSGQELLGTLLLGRGSVQWWPRGNKTNALRKNWKQFADILTKYMVSRGE